MIRLARGVLAALLVLAVSAPPAPAASLRTGTVDDPADAQGRLDIASVGVSYDDGGAIALRVRLHEALASDAEAVLDWAVSSGDAAAGCGDTRQGLAGLVDPGAQAVELTFTEANDGDAVHHDVPSTLTVTADRRGIDLEARAAALAGRDLRCVQLSSSDGDAVPAFALLAAEDPAAVPAAPVGDGQAVDGAPLTVSEPRLSLRHSGRLLVATVRPTVCAPAGSRLRMVVVETRGPVGSAFRGTRSRHRYIRTQRRSCQTHRMTWRFRARPGLRHRLVVSIVVSAAPG